MHIATAGVSGRSSHFGRKILQ